MDISKRRKESQKLNKKIWKSLGIDRVVKIYGFLEVKASMNNWLNYQRENAKLLKEKRVLEEKLAEVEKKL